MNQDTSQNSSKLVSKYAVTPGLTGYFFKFLNHCRAAENAPIMIVGPTGVGKSLFLQTYKKFYENEQRSKGITRPIVGWANCSHFGGVNSDPNIARAELFGQKKGSSQNVDKDKKGLVDAADGGALILEEIGELPLEVQSMLLTFIESGEYRSVGSNKTKNANIRIVGATNHEDALREDFKYRFFPFYLPDLKSRRGDVLYYLSHMHPELLSSLTKSEVLKMLAYHWPGNVREIDRVVRLIYRDKFESDSIIFDTAKMQSQFQLGRFYRLEETDTPISKGSTDGLLDVISGWGGDSEFLESLLGKFRVGLSDDDPAPAFNDYQLDIDQQYDEHSGLAEFEKEYDVKLLLPIKQFEDALRGYFAFCGLFMQEPYQNSNVLENIESGDIKHLKLGFLGYTDEEKRRVHRLSKAVMQYLKQIMVEDLDDNESLGDFWNELVEFADVGKVETRVGQNKSQTRDVFDLPEKVLMRQYYLELLRKNGYCIKDAAEKAGLHQSTFRSRLKKMGLENIKERKKHEK
jgi:DNA-binding NtrC family response regulator